MEEARHSAWSGIGIATGYATIGAVGFEDRLDYAAIGQSRIWRPGYAARRSMARFYSERVKQSIREHVLIEPVGDLTLKGFPKPIVTYNVTGLAEQGPS